MKKKPILLSALIILFTLSSCDKIPEIFTYGGGVGIFAVLAILVIIAYVLMPKSKKK